MSNLIKLTILMFTITGAVAFAIPSDALALGSSGDGGCCDSGSDDDSYTPPPPPPTPTDDDDSSQYVTPRCVSFTANTSRVPHGGGNVTLTWTMENASSANISGVGDISVRSSTGSQTVFVSSNTTFTLTVNGSSSNSCAVSVTVDTPPAVPATCVSFTADKTTVPYGGGNVTLTWTTQNASSVNISGVANGLSANGARTVAVTGNTTFTLTAVGAGGNDSHCTVSITVAPASAPVCLSFTANKNSVSHSGENVTLSWSTQNATSVSINNGVGSVTPVSSGSHTVFVNSNITYTLTVNGAGGQTTCTVSISKGNPPVETPKCEYLRASDTRVEEGDSITLSWSTTHADDVTISPQLGSVSRSGSNTVTINDDTTFTLRAKNDNGQEAKCTVTVNVDEDEDEDEDNEPKPKCELEVSKKRVNKGDKVTLSWDTSRAEDIRIRDDRGNTIFDTDDYRSSDRRKYFDGEIDVIINRDTEFTLNARGDGGSKTCKVEVETEDDLAVYENRDQGYVIALTQVPYTGFEAGPFLTFLFYAVLTLWALFIAYVLVIKKSSVLGFSLYGNNGASAANEADIANRKKVEALVAKYSGQNGN